LKRYVHRERTLASQKHLGDSWLETATSGGADIAFYVGAR
jgi:hypothetical protein